ncbi:amidase [Rhodococcus opacus]|uniref:amidase n=1 Tax=Rhodococcus opacus TaxID=37919 RepID=UPI0024B917A0|nr:amidase [Rhodococcus opacus]MDJ0419879.1 amidase [Rhodococcus opacus]MDV6245262.1 amidase [Rhodococcus opacus]
MTTTELHRLDATEQADLIRRGTVTTQEFVRASITQISSSNDRVNAVVSTRFEKALSEAQGSSPAGPFTGVPTLVKDLGCGTAGEPMWCGNRVLKRKNYRAERDGAITEALRAAGFIILGRTNTAEFGATITTEPHATGACTNPWDPELSAGGSSGGSAAAVAAGYVPIAHGTDASGSIRIPAATCGVIGLKPTNGSLPLDNLDGGGWFGLSSPGLFGRTVRDVRNVFAALRYGPPGDHHAVIPEDLHTSRTDTSTIPLSVAVVRPTTDADTAAVMDRVVTTMMTLGHIVEDATPPFLNELHWRRDFLTLVGAGTLADIRRWERIVDTPIYPHDLDASTAVMAGIGMRANASAVARAVAGMRNYRKMVASWWDSAAGVDLIVTPVLGHPHARLGWLSDPSEGPDRIRQTMLYTAQFNMSGDPAMALPLGTTAAGLPVGLQFAAPHGREDILFRIATELERELPWSHRVPETN